VRVAVDQHAMVRKRTLHEGLLSIATLLFSDAFTAAPQNTRRGTSRLTGPFLSNDSCTEASVDGTVAPAQLDPDVASKFKILTCSSTSCAAKREAMNLDEYDTYAAFWVRIQERAPDVQIAESPCLGCCKMAPCVAVEHEDYEGTVGLEGMRPAEFSDRVFHGVIDEDDAERVWSCVENAVRVMEREEQEVDEEEDLD
jgi:hypothetical protein